MNTKTTSRISEKKQSGNSIYLVIIGILIVLLLFSLAFNAILFFTKTTNISPSITPTLITSTLEKGEITGNISFPSENIPALTICAVAIPNKQETCTYFPAETEVYKLEVKSSGQYYVYAKDASASYTAYYVKCDSNKNIECENQKWHQSNFVCYNDAACKLAFMPMAVGVTIGKTTTGINISQGWYLPCSETDCPSGVNNPSWKNYFN